MQMKVKKSDWPAKEDWPKAGWKHALNYQQFRSGDVFGFTEDGRLWSGIVEETKTCSVKVRDILPAVQN